MSYVVTDQQLMNDAIYRLLENGNADAALTMQTTMYTPAQLVAALNDRQRRFLRDTGCILKCATWATKTGQPRYTINDGFPKDWIETRRLGWAFTPTASTPPPPPPPPQTVTLQTQFFLWQTFPLIVSAFNSVTLPQETFTWSQPHPFGFGVIAFAGAQNLLQNPSFYPQNTTDWTVVSGTPKIIQAPDGVHTFRDDPNSTCIGANVGTVTLQQTVTTTNGHVYTLSFWVQGTSNPGDGSTITVFWNATTEFTVTDLDTAGLWVQHSFSVTGTGSDTVKFTLHDPTTFLEVLIDEFAVNP